MPSLLKTIKNALCRLLQARWAVAFWVDGRLMVVGNPYRDRWFADPFIVDADDKTITLLVEDFSLQTLKGSISELTIDRATWKICQRRPVLEEPLQLSFPYIVRREGDWVWFMPESSRANRLSLYCYNRADGSCRRERDLVAVDLSDSILLDGYVLATQGEGLNGDTLHLYRKQGESYVASQPLVFKERVARNAGAVFEHQGKRYRPAQVCNEWYGEALSIQEITGEVGRWTMSEVRRLTPPPGFEGLHTLNTYHDLWVTDLKYYPHPWLSKWAYVMMGRTDL